MNDTNNPVAAEQPQRFLMANIAHALLGVWGATFVVTLVWRFLTWTDPASAINNDPLVSTLVAVLALFSVHVAWTGITLRSVSVGTHLVFPFAIAAVHIVAGTWLFIVDPSRMEIGLRITFLCSLVAVASLLLGWRKYVLAVAQQANRA